MPNSTVNAILKFNRGRDPFLLKWKLKQMAKSPFCFFRGTDHLFAADWHELKPRSPGPAVLCCGDLHLENYGAFVTDDGQPRYDINDFDEAIVAPCSYDVVRSTASIFLAAEEWQLPPVQAATMALSFVSHYRKAVTEAVKKGKPGEIILGGRQATVLDLLQNYLGSHKLLLKAYTTRLANGHREIVHDAKHFRLRRKVFKRIKAAVERYGTKHDKPDEYHVLDVSGRIAGIGSLGIKRYTVLIAGPGPASKSRLLDIKLAVPSSILGASSCKQPTHRGNEAKRVVAAQRQLQGKPTRGLDVLEIDREFYRVRDMIADENRSKLDNFREDPDRLCLAVELAGTITGWMHVRGSHLPNRSVAADLAHWAQEPAMDAVLASAIRYAARTKLHYAAMMDYGSKKLKRAIGDQSAPDEASAS